MIPTCQARFTGRRWRSPVAVAAATTLAAAGAAVLVTAASADTNAGYVLVNRNSGKALDLYNAATNVGSVE